MTNLNKLFSKYFIITIAIVLIMLTLVSNLGGSAFFRRFIKTQNDDQNASIVEIISDVLENESINTTAYPLFLAAISRQEQVDLILWNEGEIISFAQAGANWRRYPLFSQIGGRPM